MIGRDQIWGVGRLWIMLCGSLFTMARYDLGFCMEETAS